MYVCISYVCYVYMYTRTFTYTYTLPRQNRRGSTKQWCCVLRLFVKKKIVPDRGVVPPRMASMYLAEPPTPKTDAHVGLDGMGWDRIRLGFGSIVCLEGEHTENLRLLLLRSNTHLYFPSLEPTPACSQFSSNRNTPVAVGSAKTKPSRSESSRRGIWDFGTSTPSTFAMHILTGPLRVGGKMGQRAWDTQNIIQRRDVGWHVLRW